jgi:hypothetical protein
MTRSHRAVRTAARRLTGDVLIWGALASLLPCAASARQDPQPFPSASSQARLVARNTSNAMRIYIDNETAVPRFDEARLPPNLIIVDSLQQMVEAMLKDSATFRRQCARLKSTPSLTVNVEYVILAAAAQAQAVTDVTTERNGQMHAHVKLGQTAADREQVLAHEFEHIVEQLDGVDLAALATHGTAGVRITEGAGRFETERAIAIGQLVAEEIRSARRKQ